MVVAVAEVRPQDPDRPFGLTAEEAEEVLLLRCGDESFVYSQRTARLTAAAGRSHGRNVASYRCPRCHACHVGPVPSVPAMVRIAAAVRTVHARFRDPASGSSPPQPAAVGGAGSRR